MSFHTTTIATPPRALSTYFLRLGFDEIEIFTRNDSFTTLAQLILNLRAPMGRASDGLDQHREKAQDILLDVADQLARLAPLDVNHWLPLGYAAIAHCS